MAPSDGNFCLMTITSKNHRWLIPSLNVEDAKVVGAGVSYAYGNGGGERILTVSEVQAGAWGLHAWHI
jgi:hypothetical protein